MLISDFDFDLPQELIAQEPLAERDRSKMLVVDRALGSWRDASFTNLPALLDPEDLVVLNNTRVFPARLLGERLNTGAKGAAIEALLVRAVSQSPIVWEVLARPGRALKIGAKIAFGGGRLKGEVVGFGEEGRRLIRFDTDEEFQSVVDEIGNTPLPPYIKRSPTPKHRLDEPRYQTIYAQQRGAIAAPTAGLHFTPEIFNALKTRGIDVIEITHHVGYATFQPVRVESVEDHRIASEIYEISQAAADAVNRAKKMKRRVVAIGTTTTRALESAVSPDGSLRAETGSTELFIYPGHQFRTVDAMLTNFHLPQSSLLVLVSAFAGMELTLAAYRHAVHNLYRFYSYGDCMFIR
jgi:S-adenosylmethionine:tRNA ribosyltransferase-isomerase